ncbi:MAG: hypothetical protein RSE54_04045 [Ruthenibacterium sp.]
MKAYKGFNSKLQCTPGGKVFQYEIGKEYAEESEAVCEKGFHACEYPLDVFGYYPPAGSRFCEVEQSGDVSREDDGGKTASSKIKIGAEIGIAGICKAAIGYTFERAKKENAATGIQGAASATGYQGAASTTGDQGAASATGADGVASSLGIHGKARGKIGCFIVLSEWVQDKSFDWHRKSVKSKIVDGVKIKENTFYTLKSGRFVECEE